MKSVERTRIVLTTFLIFILLLLTTAILKSQDCNIYKFKAKHTHCVDNEFIARISFKYENTSEQFHLSVNGADSGLYYYDDLPLWIGPLAADGITPYAFAVEDAETMGCGYLYTMAPFSCCDEECEIEDFEAEVEDCENGEFWATINFDHENTGDQFQLYVNGADSGLFYYDDLPISVGPLVADGLTPYAFWAEDAETMGCGYLYTMYPVSCFSFYGECDISNFKAKPKFCHDGEFYAKIQFNHENTSDQFQLYVNGVDSGLFYYDDLPVYVGPLAADGMTPYAFWAEDIDSAGCGYLYTMDPVECPNFHDCNLWDLSAKVRNCSDGTFFAKINVKHQFASEQFRLWVNDADSGLYSYHDLPIYVGPLPADSVTPFAFMAEDAENEGCQCMYTLDPVQCGGGCADNFGLIVNIFPVPARNTIEITLDNSALDKSFTIEVLDMSGLQYVYQKSDGKLNAIIDIETLEPGIYFLRVIDSSTTVEVRKFIVR